MDSVTHALSAAAACILLGRPDLLPWTVAGGVAPDVDALFGRFSDPDPRFFIFTHGGITHSAAGAAAVAMAAAGVVSLVAGLPSGGAPTVLAAGLLGAVLHLSIDLLAYPGIPLLFPISERKYTFGVFAGPSVAIMGASLLFVGCTSLGACSGWGSPLYAGTVLGYVGFRILLKGCMTVSMQGRTIPTINPFRWLVIRETPSEYIVDGWLVGRGATWSRRYMHCTDMDGSDRSGIAQLPEVRRLVFASYIVTAERGGGTIRLRDPLRAEGIIWYPPHYTELELSESVLPQHGGRHRIGR